MDADSDSEFEIFEVWEEAHALNEAFKWFLEAGHSASIAMMLAEVWRDEEVFLKVEEACERARAMGLVVTERFEQERGYYQPKLVTAISGVDLPSSHYD